MIVVLAPPGAGASLLTSVLRQLGCRIQETIDSSIDDAIIAAAGGSWEWTDPDALAHALPSLVAEHRERALAAVPRSTLVAVADPRLCVTLPFWRSVLTGATFVVLHRHPMAAALELCAERGVPISAGLSMWQRAMLGAIHATEGAPRVLVSYDQLARDPIAAARDLHRSVGAARGTTLARLEEIAALATLERDTCSDAQLTRAQRDLHEALAQQRWPALDREEPFADLARDPLILLDRAQRAAAPIVIASDDAATIAAELGRARTAVWHLELRERESARKLAEVSAQNVAAAREIERLRAALERLAGTAELEATTEPRPKRRAFEDPLALATADERLRLSQQALHVFAKQLYREWTSREGIPYCGLADRKPMRVMIGTLHSDENEFDQCVESVRRQRYRHFEHQVFSGLGKKESIATLMSAFQQSDCELLIKVDADMVLTAPDFVERVVRVFQANPDIDMLCVAILDFFSGGPIQGINAYRKTAAWSESQQDSLFTDRTQVPDHKRLVVWPTFVRDAVHAPNPSAFQAFHFGVHRGLKTLQRPGKRYHEQRAEEQLVYLERTWNHFQIRRDARLGFACLGFELALTGCYRLEELDYTNPSLRESFAQLEELDVAQIESAVIALREQRLENENVERVRGRREELVRVHDAYVESIVVLLPHTKVFGGVNRFFELARQFARLGVRFVIAIPDSREGVATGPRSDYPDVEVKFYSEVIDQEWDVVLCGDAFGGVMLTMPLFRAKSAAVYLLNGWGRNPLNLPQIEIVNPDVIIANSSFAAAQYVGLAPEVVPGGVDLEMFHPPAEWRTRGERLRLGAYPGRRKPSKRFEDTVAACEMLHARGIPIELHAFDQGPLHIDVPFPLVFHGALEKERVREFFWNIDVMVCAEEDGGWSNPAAEAMACGTPLVCTDAGTIDYAIDGETALRVPRRDPKAIADAIERLYRDPALAERLRTAGLARIRGFGWPQVARGLLDALQTARLDRRARAMKNATAMERLQKLGVR